MSDPHLPGLPVGESVATAFKTKLVTDPTTAPTYSINRENDTRTAICRGLKEYVWGLSGAAFGGRDVRMKQVYQNWADPNKLAEYPSATIWTEGPGKYDAHSFTPTVNPNVQVTAPGGRPTFLVKMAEFEIDLTLDIFATDNREREEVCNLLERAFSPVDFMYGFRLDLPHFFGERATYEPLSLQYLDSEENAMRGWRHAQFQIRATVPVPRLFQYPLSQPGTVLRSVGTSPVVENVGGS